MACGLTINAASPWAEGLHSHKSSQFRDLSRPHHQLPSPPAFTVDIPDRALKTSKVYPRADPPRSPVANTNICLPPRLGFSTPTPSPFAAINYRDPLLTYASRIKIALPASAPTLLPQVVLPQPTPQIGSDHEPPLAAVASTPVPLKQDASDLLSSVSPSPSSSDKAQKNRVSRKICRMFQKKGCCPFGSQCNYVHGTPHSPPKSPPNTQDTTTSLLPTPPRDNQPEPPTSPVVPPPSIPSHPPLDPFPPKTDMKDPPPSQAVAADTPSSGGVGATRGPYVVKLPKQSRVKSRRYGRHAKVKPTPSDLPSSSSLGISNDSVPFVDVGSGHSDQFLFDNPCDNPTPVLNVPSSLRRNIKNNRKIRTPHRQPVEQCDPGPSTLEREHSRISDTSSESLSDGFSSVSATSSQTSVGQDVVTVELYTFHRRGHDREGGTLPLLRPLYSSKYLAPEKPPGLEHIIPRPIRSLHNAEAVPQRKRLSDPLPPAEYIPPRKPTGNLTVTILDHSHVKFGPGFEVLEFTTGFESRWIHIRNLPPNLKADAVTQLVKPFGNVTELRFSEGSTSAKAQFAHLSEALEAANVLEGARAFDRTIHASLSVGSSFTRYTVQDATVLLMWTPPGRVGYAGYETLEAANAAIAAADGPMGDSFVTASLYRGLPALGEFTVRLQGLPPFTKAEEVQARAKAEDVMLERPNYVSSELALKIIREQLQPFPDATFELVKPSLREKSFRAFTTFASPQIAAAATDYLNSQRPGFLRRCKFRAYHTKTLTYTISEHRFSKILEDLWDLRDSCLRRYSPGTTLKFSCRPGVPYLIRASSESVGDLRSLKAEVENLLYGEILKDDGKPVWDRFFSHFVGRTYLDNLQRQHPSVLIRAHGARRLIVMFGSSVGRKAVREEILRYVAQLKRHKVRTIPLTGRAIGLLMSAELISLQRRLGPENVVLDLSGRSLKVRGNDATFEQAQAVVRSTELGKGSGKATATTTTSDDDCPVCFSPATHPVKLECGHSWCKGCLNHYFVAAIENKSFPLTCLGDDGECPALIPITSAQDVLPAAQFDALVNASFTAYVHSKPEQFFYCPTADCSQIYRTATQSTVLQCPACLVRICPVCHVEYHDGFDCADRNLAGGEQRFREWSKEHDVKNCPGCKVPIERSEGCNHMTCAWCHTHICWVCMKTFRKGDDVYDHMRAAHGGIGL